MPSREAARRQAVDTLRLASSIAAYAAGRISADGLGPGEARQAAAYAASELEEAAGAAGQAEPGRAGRGLGGAAG